MKKAVVVTIVLLAAVLGWLLLSEKKHAAGAPAGGGGQGDKTGQGGAASDARGLVATPVSPTRPGKSTTPLAPGKSRQTAQQVLSAMDLPENIRVIAGLEPDKTYQRRCRAVQSLGQDLGTNEIAGLYVFLACNYDDYKNELQPLEFESIRNDTLDALLRQNRLPADLGKQMLKMFKDPGQNAIWRDYCLQHFQPYCEARWKTPEAATNDPEWAEVTNAYWRATRETGGTIAGTALIGMRTVAGKYPALSKEQVAQRALALAMDDACGEPSRITALRICGQMGQQEVVPQARVLAQTGQSIMLRCAAMATIGDLGGKADMELLQSFSAAPDQRVRAIAAAALKRLHGRLAKSDQALQ